MNDLSQHPTHTALVLGDGGSAGNAWLIGVVAGLGVAGLDVTGADLIIGTSAGSTAAAQITGACPAELLADILDAAPQPRSAPVESDGADVRVSPVADQMERSSRIIASAPDAADMRRRIGGRRSNAGGVGRLRASAVARYRCRPTSQPVLAATATAYHGARCPHR
ncbi:hypothetical protein [Cryobacterium adonitolivorans]|uniref:hypothetical protein n=1 Tax=Cryobacterium adonitolivorans TaxID=1259189 RepID=UPI0030BA25F3